MDNIELKYVKLSDTKPGTQWKGYFGGTYINKWGKPNITLYNKNSNGGYTCTALGLSADLKKKILPNTAFLDLEYRGMTFTGKYNCHSFTVRCTPVPQNNPKALDFLSMIKAHTAALASENPMVTVSADDPFSELGAPVQESPKEDPFSALDAL